MADQSAPLPPPLSPRPSNPGGPGDSPRTPPQSSPIAAARAAANQPVNTAGGRVGAGGRGGFTMPKFGNPLSKLSGVFAGLTGKLPANWWVGAVIFVMLIGGYFYFQSAGVPTFSAGAGTGDRAMTFPGMPGIHLIVTLATLALMVDCVLGLVEAQNREDPGWLDWWIPYVVTGLLVYGQIGGMAVLGQVLTLGVGLWWLATGIALGGLVFASLWNPSDQEDPQLMDRIDTTAVFRTCFILGILYLAKWVVLPYPTFVPLIVIVIVGILAIFKEIMRTPKFALLVIAMGVIAAVIYNPLAIFGTLAASVIFAALGAHQGWIPGASSQRHTEIPINIMGRKAKLIMAWDVVICWFAVFILTAIVIYANPVIMIIGAL